MRPKRTTEWDWEDRSSLIKGRRGSASHQVNISRGHMARSQFHAAPFFSAFVTMTGKREKEKEGLDVSSWCRSALIRGGERAWFFFSRAVKSRSHFRCYTSSCVVDCCKIASRRFLREEYIPGKTIRKGRKDAGGDGGGKSPFVLFRVRISGDVRLRLPRSFRFTRNWIIDLL